VARKKRIYGSVEGLGDRITILESLVKGLLPEADLSSIDEMQRIGRSLGIPLPTLHDSAVGSVDGEPSATKDDEESTIQAIPDQQNQIQYVGPSSSFLFHLKLRRMIGNPSISQFEMFGSNAADQVLDITNTLGPEPSFKISGRRESSNGLSGCGSPSDTVRDIDGSVLETLMDAYFEIIHSDFPVFHEASFRETYEKWSSSSSTADPAWLCSVLCLLILSRRVAPVQIPDEAEKKWWRHVQALLPTVMFSSNLYTVQSLMLAALHLHNTNHRDACWNLTGTAVRVAYAIGLHRDDITHAQGRVGRELRKQLWWTVYGFEQMQVSSYDRPSAIAYIPSTVGCPNGRILGTAGHYPPDFTKWTQKLLIILGSANKALNPAGTSDVVPPDDAYSKPLSPTAAVLRDLERWKEGLPSHLHMDVVNSLAPSSQRPLVLLHIQYYYILTLVTRSALLRRAMILTHGQCQEAPLVTAISDTSIEAGMYLGKLLGKLDSINSFNAVTWFDIFYLVAAALVLVLDLRVNNQNGSTSNSESRALLRDLASLASRHMQNPRMPGSMRALAQIVVDVDATATQFTAGSKRGREAEPRASQSGPALGRDDAASPLATVERSPQNPHSSPTNLATPSVTQEPSSVQAHKHDTHFWGQLSFMDEPNSVGQDWSWDDIGAIVRTR
jgi:hypothetical protein